MSLEILQINQGGTGLASIPALNEILVGDGVGNYALQSLTTTLSGYVPYTGATTNVDLGTHTLTVAEIDVNKTVAAATQISITNPSTDSAAATALLFSQGGNSRFQLVFRRSTLETTLLTGTAVSLGLGVVNTEIINIDASTKLVKLINATSSIGAILDTATLATSDKTFTFPNTSGTFALTSDLAAYLPLAGGTMSGDILMGNNDIFNVKTLTIGASAVTANSEVLNITTATANYGWLHTDGTRVLASYLDTSGGWLGTISNHPLQFYANSSAAQMEINAAGGVKFDSNITFNANNTQTIGTTTVRPGNVFLQKLSVGDKTTLTTPSVTNPVIFDFQRSSAGATLDAGRFISENTSTAVASVSRAIYAKIVPHSQLSGSDILKLDIDVTSLGGAILGSGINYTPTFNGTNVDTAYGITMLLTGTGTPPAALVAGYFSASGAAANYALLTDRGDVVFNSTGGSYDFKVITPSENNALYVQGSTNRVGINQATPAYQLDVNGAVGINGNLTFGSATQTITKGASTVQNQNLLDKTATETVSGSWTKSTNPLFFLDNIAAKFGTSGVASIFHDGNFHLRCTSGVFFIGNTSGTPRIIFESAGDLPFVDITSTGKLQWNVGSGNGGFEIFQPVAITNTGLTADPQIPLGMDWTAGASPTTTNSGINLNIRATGTTETANVLVGVGGGTRLVDNGSANAGRNFSAYEGLSFFAVNEANQAVTWAANAPKFIGLDVTAGSSGTGVMTGTSNIVYYAMQPQAVINADASGAMTVAALYSVRAIVSIPNALTNTTVTEAAAFYASLTLQTNVTRGYGLLIPTISGSLPGTLWGVNSSYDIQVASDAKLILEGSATVKGDTYMSFISASNRIDTYVNNVLQSSLSSNLLDIVGDVRGRQMIADGDNAGVASTNSLTGTSDLTGNSTGVGTILFKGTTSRNSSGFIKVFIGTTAYYVPAFSAITG